MVCTTVSTAASIVGKWQIAAETASGIGCSFMVALVIMPKVPSDPMNKSVKLYPADDFLGPISIKKTCTLKMSSLNSIKVILGLHYTFMPQLTFILSTGI